MRRAERAFTLIELLVVMAIIGILAGMVLVAIRPIKEKKMIALARTELAQVETAIAAYKAKYNFYPPDNPANPAINQLYFELAGTALANLPDQQIYVTLDESASIPATPAAFQSAFGSSTTVGGLMNVSRHANPTDDAGVAINFLKGLQPNQTTAALPGSPGVKILICSVAWEHSPFLVPGDSVGLNPWQYNSSRPTHNPQSYDLWVDLVIRGKTNRINNWSHKPEVL